LKEVSGNGASPSEVVLWGSLEGGLLYWGPWRICIKGSGNGNDSPYCLRSGNWKGDPIPGTLNDE